MQLMRERESTQLYLGTERNNHVHLASIQSPCQFDTWRTILTNVLVAKNPLILLFYFIKIQLDEARTTMSGKDRRLVADEPVEFGK